MSKAPNKAPKSAAETIAQARKAQENKPADIEDAIDSVEGEWVVVDDGDERIYVAAVKGNLCQGLFHSIEHYEVENISRDTGEVEKQNVFHYVIELTAPCRVVKKGAKVQNGDDFEVPAGKRVRLGVRHQLLELAELVTEYYLQEIRVTFKGQAPIKGGRSVWMFRKEYRGTKLPRPAIARLKTMPDLLALANGEISKRLQRGEEQVVDAEIVPEDAAPRQLGDGAANGASGAKAEVVPGMDSPPAA